MGQLAEETKELLRRAGWTFLRSAKGDHEIWHDPKTARKVTIDHSMKSRHTANEVLKKAGLPKAF
ncbi:MAG: type II toxin-antitoxin system HicA family toxin [Rhizobiaceae bacterium]|nr:type II toxin-antitoxin system HicA family toxin [Rhizobiaceae bacterium]